MANTDAGRRRGATPIAGKPGGAPEKARPKTRRATGRRGTGAIAPAAPPKTPPKAGARRTDRFHAVWATGQFAALIGALICGGVIAYLLNAGTLQVRQFQLSGATLTSPDDVAAASGVSGHNIFTVEPQAVAARLIALPTISEAQVWGELPDRLVVKIVERQPALIWQLGEDKYLLGNDGFVIAKNLAGDTIQGLPKLTVRGGDPPAVGGRVDAALIGATLTIGQRSPGLGVTVVGVEYAPASGLTIITPNSAGATGMRQIVLGSADRLVEKLAIAGEIIRTEQAWTVLNVTDPDRPFFPAKQP